MFKELEGVEYLVLELRGLNRTFRIVGGKSDLTQINIILEINMDESQLKYAAVGEYILSS